MPKELFCVLLAHRGKLRVTFANERFEPTRPEPSLPWRVFWRRVRKRIQGC